MSGLVNHPISRRRFLGAAGVAAAGAVLPARSSVGATSSDVSQAGPPKYIPFKGPKPDLPALPNEGIPAAYYHYPANPSSFVNEPPGNGDNVSMLLQGTNLVAESSNRWWQALNKALNVNLTLSAIPFSSYAAKLSVVTAGGDIPDACQMGGIPGELPILEKYFEDLTPYLSGDAIKEYPGLASIPPQAWQISTINGRIWGTPQPRPSAGSTLNYRGDTVKKLGLNPNNLRDGKDFMNFCKELTNAKQNLWAWGEEPNTFVLSSVLEMMDAPNTWKVENGKFTSVYESPQMKEALNVVSQMWKSGYIEPDSFANPAADQDWFEAGRITLYYQSFVGWAGIDRQHPEMEIGVIHLPKWNGGGFAKKQLALPGYGDFTAYKKGSKKRIKEMLGIANYIAAPFGTKEYLLVNQGVEGWDYTLSGSDPTLTPKQTSESLPTSYVSSQSGYVLYTPGNNALVDAEYNYLKEVMSNAEPLPTLGLYSATNLTNGASATLTLTNLQAEIIQGRTPLSQWDSAVKTWKQQAGQKIAQEYSQSYEKAHSKNSKK